MGGVCMPRNVFASIHKISAVLGRIDYISNPERQEHLYATYSTTDRVNYWKDLQEVSEEQHFKYGEQGDVIAAREWIVALDESLVELEPEKILRAFVDAFHEKYGVECTAALHHNTNKTNYHIHMIFSERKLLSEPVEKIATRNMFFDEHGKHRRTKKEILDADGNLRKGCKIVPKGEAYEKKIFTSKDEYFKSIAFREEVKDLFLELNNSFIKDANRKLTKFDPESVYLPTKKIGKNNPKAEYIKAENDKRMEWNQTVDQALIGMVNREDILNIKDREIKEEIKVSFAKNGYKPDMFIVIVSKAIQSVSNLLERADQKVIENVEMQITRENIKSRKRLMPPPVEPDMSKQYDTLKLIYEQLVKHSAPIRQNETTIKSLEAALSTYTSPFQILKKLECERAIAQLKLDNDFHRNQQDAIISRNHLTCVDSFMKLYFNCKKAREDYKKAVIDWLNHRDDTTNMSAEKIIAEQKEETEKLKNSSIKEKMEKAKHQTKQNVHIYEAKKSAKDRQ